MDSMEQQQKIFEEYCRDCNGGFGSDADRCTRSKTVTKSKGGKIVRILQGNCRDLDSAQFKHWVKTEGI